MSKNINFHIPPLKLRGDGGVMQMKFLCNKSELKRNRKALRRDSTEAEKLLWSKLRNRQFFDAKFFRQYSIDSYVIDFYCPQQRIAIELDGGQHIQSTQYDRHRTLRLAQEGVRVLRFWNNEVMSNLEGVLERLAKEVTPPSPLNLRGGIRKRTNAPV